MKIAVITGASSGMGWECAIRLWEQFPGLDEIWAVGRRKERLVKLEEKVNIPVRKFVLDLSQEKEREILKAELERLKPQVKFLVNAAGFGKIGNVCDLSEKDHIFFRIYFSIRCLYHSSIYLDPSFFRHFLDLAAASFSHFHQKFVQAHTGIRSFFLLFCHISFILSYCQRQPA
jgi:NAD(P)-dependent dehydrogenase (short-subunit alcohol dehydrogenase family)